MSNGRGHMRWDTRIFSVCFLLLGIRGESEKICILVTFSPIISVGGPCVYSSVWLSRKSPMMWKKSPHHSRKKSRIFTLLLFLLRRRFEVKPRAEAQPAPPGFSFSGDLWQNFWSIHPYARPPFSPYMPTELWQKPNISYKGIEFLMPPLGWLVAGDF